MNTVYQKIFCFGLSTLLFVLSGCKGNPTLPPDSPRNPAVISSSTGSSIVLSTFSELLNHSDLVIIGKIVSAEKVINTARRPDDSSATDERLFGIGQVYQVSVDQTLKGNEFKTIYLVQSQGLLETGGKDPSQTDINKAIEQNQGSYFLPIKIDTPYLMFLRTMKYGYSSDGYKDGELFTGTAHPWRFIVQDNATVQLEDELQNLGMCFPAMPLSQMKTLMNDPQAPSMCSKESIYPPPGSNSTSDGVSTAYP